MQKMKFSFISTVLTFVMVVSLSFEISAQSRSRSSSTSTFTGTKNAFFAEVLGNGLLFSVNYDLRLVNSFGARIGVGYVGSTEGDGGILTVPVMGNFLLGKNGRYFEVGAGISYISGTGEFFDNESSILGTMSFMYRRQPEDGGFMWKIGLTPFIAEGVFIPYWGGVGIGYCW